eukprot:TRINITY_DN1631_c0_g1_i3.p2 TRINITY_DN1631_c0_g1~~TRINITY_DN1631_c0_g1_i3.p2  ORF type:complete len:267 (-),score=43.10 TRINITY_DN1631_c0_g1_i3:1016-1816(-)
MVEREEARIGPAILDAGFALETPIQSNPLAREPLEVTDLLLTPPAVRRDVDAAMECSNSTLSDSLSQLDACAASAQQSYVFPRDASQSSLKIVAESSSRDVPHGALRCLPEENMHSLHMPPLKAYYERQLSPAGLTSALAVDERNSNDISARVRHPRRSSAGDAVHAPHLQQPLYMQEYLKGNGFTREALMQIREQLAKPSSKFTPPTSPHHEQGRASPELREDALLFVRNTRSHNAYQSDERKPRFADMQQRVQQTRKPSPASRK